LRIATEIVRIAKVHSRQRRASADPIAQIAGYDGPTGLGTPKGTGVF
jgi:hypothetical protein